MRSAIENAIEKDQWPRARKLIEAALRKEPDSHWLLNRLSLTYYEERQYERALKYSQEALSLAPNCPLVLWDHAGTLAMLGRNEEAINLYKRLIKRGAPAIAIGDCGEGLARARGLVADCWYRMYCCYRELGARGNARNALQHHMTLRGPGCHSVYAMKDVKKELARVVEARSYRDIRTN